MSIGTFVHLQFLGLCPHMITAFKQAWMCDCLKIAGAVGFLLKAWNFTWDVYSDMPVDDDV